MRILHISSYYTESPLYSNLLRALEQRRPELKQTMYVPHLRSKPLAGRNDYSSAATTVLYSADYSSLDRVRYRRRIRNVAKSIMQSVDLSEYDLIHGHHLFTAGGVAYLLNQSSGIPFISALRNTDINSFFRKAPPLRPFGRRIMAAAAGLVFVSPAHQPRVLGGYLSPSQAQAAGERSVVIPNGVDGFWLDNINDARTTPSEPVRLIFVGSFTRNKNLPAVLETVRLLLADDVGVRIQLVGSGPDEDEVRRLADQMSEHVEILPWVDAKEDLRDLYRHADVFVMPSFTETFGLTYIEAMSQGLPVIYTQGEGIDGYFQDGEIGYGVDPNDPRLIADRVKQILGQYQTMSARCLAVAHSFSWDSVADRYLDLYDSVLAGSER